MSHEVEEFFTENFESNIVRSYQKLLIGMSEFNFLSKMGKHIAAEHKTCEKLICPTEGKITKCNMRDLHKH